MWIVALKLTSILLLFLLCKGCTNELLRVITFLVAIVPGNGRLGRVVVSSIPEWFQLHFLFRLEFLLVILRNLVDAHLFALSEVIIW